MQQFHTISHIEMAVYRTGTGTLGRAYEDLGTRGKEHWDIKYGTWGRVGHGR